MKQSGHERREVRFVDLAAQHAAIYEEVSAAARRVLRAGQFVLGEEVERFEREFARYCGCAHGVGVDSGTSGLELALRAHGVGPGDEVVLPANTFIATALAVSSTGARPVLVDADPTTRTLDASRLEAVLTPRTRAILPVHLYGQPADMDPILAIAERRNLVVIEDACQAHGARYRGRRVGTLGHAAVFSFYPSKNLGACGDGGIVVTSDPDTAATLRMLRNYGQTKKYHHAVCGYNHRLDNLQAALLRVKLGYLDAWNDARNLRASLYTLLLDGAVATPGPPAGSEPVWHLYVIETNDRDELQAQLGRRGIDTGIHYPIPVHLQPAYAGLGYRHGDFPVSERLAASILSLPMYPELPLSAVRFVANAVRAFVLTRQRQVHVA